MLFPLRFLYNFANQNKYSQFSQASVELSECET